jgi:hypothetical protein
MKKKNTPATEEPVVAREILRSAKLAAQEGRRLPSTPRCVICDSEAAPNSTENLCWVCRRLKISAWRDSDQQMSAQE